jgi:hypothetical protein
MNQDGSIYQGSGKDMAEKSGKEDQIESGKENDFGKENKSGKESRKNGGRFEAVISFEERKKILMDLMSKRSLCHIKDLLSSLPNVSQRTLRYDIKRLVNNGIVERIGTGGPNSFFRLRKKEN